MNVGFFVTCIGDAPKSWMARDSVLLLEKLSCRVSFPERQRCCGQSTINSGYIKEAIPGVKNLIAALRDNDDPIISPAGFYTYAVKDYPTCLADKSEWALRAEKVSTHMQDLTSFVVNKLDMVNVGANLQGHIVYHPSYSLTHKLGVKEEPLTLLKNVCGLELSTFADQDTCCGFDGTFSIKTVEISGEVMKGKVLCLMDAKPEYLIDADVSYLLNIGGRLQREGQSVKVMCIAKVLMSR